MRSGIGLGWGGGGGELSMSPAGQQEKIQEKKGAKWNTGISVKTVLCRGHFIPSMKKYGGEKVLME